MRESHIKNFIIFLRWQVQGHLYYGFEQQFCQWFLVNPRSSIGIRRLFLTGLKRQRAATFADGGLYGFNAGNTSERIVNNAMFRLEISTTINCLCSV